MSEAPDLTQKVLGFREWGVRQNRLIAIGVNAYWPKGVQRARCVKGDSYYGSESEPCEHAPSAECNCGIYGLHKPARKWRTGLANSKWTCGVVLAWGGMEVHHDGFRAEWAEPVLLAYDEMRGPKHVARVEAVAEHYGVPVCAIDELERRSAEYGRVVPESLRPEKEESKKRSGMTVSSLRGVMKDVWTQPLYFSSGVYQYTDKERPESDLYVQPGEFFEKAAIKPRFYDFNAGEMRAA